MEVGIKAYLSRPELCDDRAKALRGFLVWLKARAPGVGVYSYDLRYLVSFIQSLAHYLAAFWFIHVIGVDFSE